jgi:hypothetical protein
MNDELKDYEDRACQHCDRLIVQVWAAFGYGDYVLSCPGKTSVGAMHELSVAEPSKAEARIAELEAALRGIYQQVTNCPLCYFGDHTGYQPQIGSNQTERWAKLLDGEPK